MSSSSVLGPAVVITGASTGIGQACALELDRRGFRVFAGVRSETAAENLQAKASSRVTPLMIDVTDAASIAAAAKAVGEAMGDAGLAGLVNNAGIAVPGPLEAVPIDALRRQFEVNLIGQVAVTQAFLPLLRKARGRVVNIGSINGDPLDPVHGTVFGIQVRVGGGDRCTARGASHVGHPGFGRGAGTNPDANLGKIHRRRRAIVEKLSHPKSCRSTKPIWQPCVEQWNDLPAALRRWTA